MPVTAFHAPSSLADALALLAAGGRPVAGGTDLVVELAAAPDGGPPGALVSLHRLAELRSVAVEDGDLVMGAGVTVATLREHPLVREHAPVLAQAADRFAGPQVRNAATLGGNLCHASPAADLAPPLLVLDAVVVLAGGEGGEAERRVPVDAFFVGPRRTARLPGELLTAVRVPLRGGRRASFQKGGTRPSMDISVVSVAASAELRDGVLRHARIALGAVGPTPLRSPAAEAVLEGAPATAATVAAAARAVLRDARPIDDVRASAAYRLHLLGVLAQRVIRDVIDR
ncbi:FAD binding domain-containing protein [Myxococcota bacterium]|nr:FAD binding domain-containing protein [Myxococcota bacterium]